VSSSSRAYRSPYACVHHRGLGLFLALIALKTAGVVAADQNTYVTLGDLHKPEVIMALLGFLLIVVLDRLKVPGALLIGILADRGLVLLRRQYLHGIFSAPPSIEPTFMKLDIKTALTTGFLNVVLVFFLVELFDATGTLMGVARRAGLLVPERMGRFNRSLLADSGAIFVGSILGTSSTTAYVERCRCAGRRPYRSDGSHGCHAVPGLPVHRTAGRVVPAMPRRLLCCSWPA
jgi:AGZA family xanthine/uracil permease-like MFS transporter